MAAAGSCPLLPFPGSAPSLPRPQTPLGLLTKTSWGRGWGAEPATKTRSGRGGGGGAESLPPARRGRRRRGSPGRAGGVTPGGGPRAEALLGRAGGSDAGPGARHVAANGPAAAAAAVLRPRRTGRGPTGRYRRRGFQEVRGTERIPSETGFGAPRAPPPRGCEGRRSQRGRG